MPYFILCLILSWQTVFAESVLRRGNGAEVQTLDPHRAEGVPAANVLRDLYEGLIIDGPDNQLQGGVAQSWQISEDGKTYIFKLRSNARWSNGDPVTAEDFVYGLRRSVDPQTGSHYAQVLAPIKNARAIIAGQLEPEQLGVSALDEKTLKIELNAPTPYFLGLLTHSTTYPVHRATIEQYGERFSRAGYLVSNGAYQLKEWVVQSHITLERNPYYWNNAQTRIDRVIYYPIENQATELKRYRAGELDITETIPIQQIRWLQKHLSDELVISPYFGSYYYAFNLTQPPFKNNPKLRRALSLAINREIITAKITRLGEQPLYSWVPPGIPNYQPAQLDYAHWSPSRRLQEAKKLYREAGYSRSQPLTVEIRYNTSENHKKIAVAIAAMWKQALGVKVKLLNEEWKVFLANRKQKKQTQVFRAGWIGDYLDPYTFMELMLSQNGMNDSGYHNPQYDALVLQSAQEQDPKKRFQLMQRAEAILLKDHAVIPLFSYVSKHLVKPHIGGFRSNLLDHVYSKDLYFK